MNDMKRWRAIVMTILEAAGDALAQVTQEQVIGYMRASHDDGLADAFAATFDYDEEEMAKADTHFADEIIQAKHLLAPYVKRSNIIYRGFRDAPDLSKPVGNHWSLDRAVTTLHGKAVLLQAVATPADVDWIGTVAHAVFWWQDEEELTLRHGAVIRLHDGQRVTV